MHAIGGSKGYTDDAGQPKKAVKVAFGSNRNLDKNNAGASNRLAQQGASVLNSAHGNNKGKAGMNSPSKDNTAQGRYGQGGVVKPGRVSAGGAMGERDNIGQLFCAYYNVPLPRTRHPPVVVLIYFCFLAIFILDRN